MHRESYRGSDDSVIPLNRQRHRADMSQVLILVLDVECTNYLKKKNFADALD